MNHRADAELDLHRGKKGEMMFLDPCEQCAPEPLLANSSRSGYKQSETANSFTIYH